MTDTPQEKVVPEFPDTLDVTPGLLNTILDMPNTRLTDLSYPNGIALISHAVIDQYDGAIVDFDFDNEDLQNAVNVSRVDVGTMFTWAVYRYLQDNLDADKEDITAMSDLQPYWKQVREQRMWAFNVYMEVNTHWLMDTVRHVESRCIPAGEDVMDDDDVMWVVERMNAALVAKYKNNSSPELLDMFVNRAAVSAFYYTCIPELMDALSVKLRYLNNLSTRARVWCTIMNLIEFVD